MTAHLEADPLASEAEALFHAHQQQIYQRTDRMFAVLLLLEWAAAVAGAFWLSPLTWSGRTSSVHPHVWLAIFLGGVLCSFPTMLACLAPGRRVTRHTIAVAQVMFSSLLIHISGGRIETHFHVFGSLAFLAAYRDWKVLIPPTIVVAVDHFARGVFWPETVFGVLTVSPWRWIEHAAWVVFEDVFLIITIRQSVAEMRETSHKTAELEWNHAQLQRSSEQLNRAYEKERAIVEGALDAVVEMDQSGLVIGWNGRAAITFGWSASEAIGQELRQLIIPEQYREAHTNGLKTYLESGTGPALNQRLELQGLHRDGSAFPIEIAVTPIHRAQETTFCAFVRDIKERKSYEKELERAKEQAETANRAKSEFLANMSHEIRTPLTGILGFADVLRRGVGSPEQRANYLDTVHSSGQHLLTLLNDILDLSKIEAGRMEFEKVRCSPHEIISEVLSVLRVRSQEKWLRLECKWTTPVPETILTDPARLRQLLMNLVGNAIKFTDTGGVTLRAAINRHLSEPRFVIEIEDTGIGIPAEHLERIFLPFDQADNSITRQFGGTGLGLAICRQIAAGLGGGVSVKSQIGRGSVFRVALETGPLDGVPLLSESLSEALKPAARKKDGSPRRVDLSSVRVLLVDDGETNRDLVSLVLERAGATVVCAENGQEGVEAVNREWFDLVLMDMQMPIMDGYTACRTLRSGGCRLPIIALTAHAMRGDRETCLAAGCTDYLAKPIQIDRLLETVAAAVGVTEALPPSPSSDAGNAADPLAQITSSLPTEHPRFEGILKRFVVTLSDKRSAMQAAYDCSDWTELAHLAHWLKGSGGTVGFDCFTKPARSLEGAAKNGDAPAAKDLLQQLDSLAERIVVPAPRVLQL